MKNLHIILMLIIFALIFIMIGHKYRESIQLRLKYNLVVLPKTTLDWWSISHFVLFFLFGIFEPGHHAKFFTIGAGFEIIEDMLASDKTTQLVDCTNPINKDRYKSYFISRLYCNGLQDDYWYGKWDDIFVNLAGYVAGSALQTQYKIW